MPGQIPPWRGVINGRHGASGCSGRLAEGVSGADCGYGVGGRKLSGGERFGHPRYRWDVFRQGIEEGRGADAGRARGGGGGDMTVLFMALSPKSGPSGWLSTNFCMSWWEATRVSDTSTRVVDTPTQVSRHAHASGWLSTNFCMSWWEGEAFGDCASGIRVWGVGCRVCG
jgi:hypothetical protein